MPEQSNVTAEQVREWAEWLDCLLPLPMAANGYVAQQHRKFIECQQLDGDRFRAIAAHLRSTIPVDVEERVPEVGEWVLLFHQDEWWHGHRVDYDAEGKAWWSDDSGNEYFTGVTHWLPLPPKPGTKA